MFAMESIIQKSILSFFDKKDGSKPTETDNSQNENDANINGANVEPPRSRKKLNEGTLMIPGKARKRKREFVAQYDKKYLEFGFTLAPGNEQCPQLVCLVCSQILSNDARKPSKLVRHFHSKYSDLKGKPLEYFERLLSGMTTQKKQMKKITSTLYRQISSSCFISHFISNSENKKPYRIGKELVKPCILTAAEDILGPETVESLKAYDSPTAPVQRRIEDMAKDVEQQVIEEVKKSLYYAIQLDESADVSNCTVLLCFVMYKGITDVKEELLWNINLPGRTTGSEIFRLLDEYFCKNKTV